MKAIIFDFDGLILDTETAEYQSWLEIYRRYGVELPFEVWAAAVGTSPDSFNPLSHLLELCPGLAPSPIKLEQKQRMSALADSLPVMPGVEDLLVEARRLGLHLAIASTSSQEWVLTHLARHGLAGRFDVIQTGDRVERVKPYPDVYIAALRELQVLAAEALALEDSPHGIQAAQNAAIFCIAVPNSITRRMDTSRADLVLDSLASISLPDLLNKVNLIRSNQV